MAIFNNPPIHIRKDIAVKALLDAHWAELRLEHINAPAGVERKISETGLYRPGLALAGHTEFFSSQKIQVCGNTEIYYLRSLKPAAQLTAFERITRHEIPCIIVTNNLDLPQDLLQSAGERNIAVLSSPLDTTDTSRLLSEFLDGQFAPRTTVHGSFVDVYGAGLLFTGRSGIGKSEIVLDLIERGHRLVSDDAVMLTRKREDILIGTAGGPAKHFMEIRGLGIIDVRQMFGMRAIRFQKRLEIIVELEEWDPAAEYTRTGLDLGKHKVLGVDVSAVKLPIFPGKNVTVIAESIALNYLLRAYGYDAAQEFSNRLQAEIARKSRGDAGESERANPYFDNDYE